MKKERRRFADTLHSKDSPDADKEANWLPAPNDTIYLVMRLVLAEAYASFDPACRCTGALKPPAIMKSAINLFSGECFSMFLLANETDLSLQSQHVRCREDERI